jgi:hypothetical protein
LAKTSKKHWSSIEDDRQVKKPTAAYVLFSTERTKSGDFTDIVVKDRGRIIGDEWKALPDSDKKVSISMTATSSPSIT